MRAKKSVSMKAVVIMMVLVLLLGCGVGGTLAYLIAAPKSVTNTFVAGEIGELTLAETKGTDKENNAKEFLIVPGKPIDKDPKVTFEGNNVDAYVFVKVNADGWTRSGSTYSINSTKDSGQDDNGMSWTVDSAWTAVDQASYPNVYYKTVSANAVKGEWSIIVGDQITVSSGITEESIADYTQNLTFTAYAIQKDTFASVAAAWDAVKDTAVATNS